MYLSIYNQNSACDRRNIEIDYLHFVFDLHMIAQW